MLKLSLCPSFLLVIVGMLFFPSIAAAQNNANEQYGTIIAKVVAFRDAKGIIQLALYDRSKEKEFPDLDTRIQMKKAAVANSSVVELRFDKIPYGSYAIAGLHDENKSGEMDYTWLGMPKEGYCFSNDCKPFLSAPTFSQAKFTLNQKEKVVYITMQY